MKCSDKEEYIIAGCPEKRRLVEVFVKGIMEGSLRAVDRTMVHKVSCSKLQRNFHVTGKQYSFFCTG